MTKREPAVEGWFSADESAPALLGARGVESGSFFWPTAIATSGNPAAPGEAREPVELSRVGRLWSWTTNHYAPPEPYVAPDPFVPYTVCAVELDTEQMVVLGLLATGADAEQLEIGMPMELVLGPLYTEDDTEYVVWQWAPKGGQA
ncbi:MAG TPA: OB-fold domain-containing protein [Acidimicrobiia bacterium]|nr:OB-fold domain-containing protein [Acidimicrobiia bacterium]